MNTRIKWIRQSIGLTQKEFSERIGLTRNFVAMVEIGKREPSDRTIADICREFGVNRVWLETGVGEPFPPRGKREDLEAIFFDVLSGRVSEKNAFIEAIAQLPDDVYPALVRSWIAAAEEMKKKLQIE